MRKTDRDKSAGLEGGILDNALVMIAVLDKKGKIFAWNRAAETLTGYTKEEVVGSTVIWKHLYPDSDYRRSVTRKIEDILATRNYFENLETTIQTRSGDSRIILWNTKEIIWEGTPRVIAVGMDITSQREADAFQKSVIDNANVLIAVLDPKGKVLVWNEAAESITGYTKDEVIGKRDIWKQLYPDPEYRRTITTWINSIIKERRLFENLDTAITTKKGEKRIIRWNTREINTGAQAREIAIGRDITLQRELDAFRESVIENAHILITVLDSQGNVLVWNKAAEAITGYTKSEVIGKRDIWKYLYPDPDYRRTITKRITKIIKEERYFENFETTIVNKGGSQRILAWNTREIDGGTQTREIAIARDITELRKAEQALRESEERYRDVVEDQTELICRFTPDGTLTFVNDAYCRYFGLNKDDCIGKHHSVIIPPDDARRMKEHIKALTPENPVASIDHRIIMPSGEIRWQRWSDRAIFDKNGHVAEYQTVGKDITPQRELDAFRESVIENAHILITVLDPQGKILMWNKAAESITGYSREEVIGSRDVWKRLYPDAEYRRSITRQISDIITRHRYFENLETTIVSKTGKRRIISWNTQEIGSGTGSREIAIGRDITEQRDAETFRKSVIENANVLITVLDSKGKILVWNKAAESVTGYLRDEVINSTAVWKWLYPDADYRRTITKRIMDIITARRYFENLETTIVTKSGEKRIISWNTRQIEADSESQAIAIGRDITEQRKAEEALIAYVTEMAMRLKQPVEIIRDNLRDVTQLIRQKKLTPDEIVIILEGQVRNATQIAANVQEFQKAIVERDIEIPEAYQKFLKG